MIKVLIADDMQILTKGLRAVLEQDPEIEVVGIASDGREAFEKTCIKNPDVVLMDMRMPEYDGAFGIQKIKEKCDGVRVLVLTTFDDDETVNKALESGADGYILKEFSDEQVIGAVKQVYQGMSVFGGKVYQTMRKTMAAGATEASKTDHKELQEQFNERELELMRYVAAGYDNKEIASELFLAEGTVRNQLSKLLERLELKDRTQLAVYAVKNGLDE